MAQTIPDDIIFHEILPRVPVKSLIRFKSVCKDWRDRISTPVFVKTHLQLSLSSPTPMLLAMQDHSYWCDFYTFAYDEKNKLKEFAQLDSHWTHEFPGMKYDLIGCCNGLVCLNVTKLLGGYPARSHAWASIFVWNPATRERRKISPPNEEDGPLSKGYFGYSLAHNDYKIIGIVSGKIWIFSLREGKWKSIIDFPYHDNPCYITSGVFVGDTLYWSVRTPGYFDLLTTHVISFSLVDEKVEEIPFTILPISSPVVHINLYVIKGCLSIHCVDHPYDVWRLKQKDDWNSWEKMFSFSRRMINHQGFTWNGKCLVEHWGRLIPVDPDCDPKEVCEDDAYYSQGVHCEGWAEETPQHVESLISPFGIY
ncbi:F-box protein CPR1 [Bienertia sinuspersici]